MQQCKRRPGRYASAIVAGLWGLAVLAPAAGAATVALVPSTDPAGDVLVYAGEGDEANDLELTGPLEGYARLADGVVILPALPCQPTNNMGEPVGGPRRFARCPWASIVLLRLAGGAGIDRLRTDTDLPTEVRGGEANDLLVGGGGPDELEGGAGGDELRGRGGRDRLEPGPGADIVQGGAGRDRVDYRNHDAAVSVDFDVVPDDGAAGEGDLVSDDVEDVLGTAFGDTLSGSPDANRLEGRGGDDTLDGGAGQDELDGGAGADTILRRRRGGRRHPVRRGRRHRDGRPAGHGGGGLRGGHPAAAPHARAAAARPAGAARSRPRPRPRPTPGRTGRRPRASRPGRATPPPRGSRSASRRASRSPTCCRPARGCACAAPRRAGRAPASRSRAAWPARSGSPRTSWRERTPGARRWRPCSRRS